jgi:hypothetical protein
MPFILPFFLVRLEGMETWEIKNRLCSMIELWIFRAMVSGAETMGEII